MSCVNLQRLKAGEAAWADFEIVETALPLQLVLLFIVAAQAHCSFILSTGCTYLMPGLTEDMGSEGVRVDRGVTSSIEYNINACELVKSHPMGALLRLSEAEGLVQLTEAETVTQENWWEV